jgi:hypothetical protein
MTGYVLKLAKIAFKYVISELLFAGSLSPLYVKKNYNNNGGGGDDENDNKKVLMMIIMVVIVMLTLIIIIIIIIIKIVKLPAFIFDTLTLKLCAGNADSFVRY